MIQTTDSADGGFLAIARRTPRLSRREETELARRWRATRDRRAADVLVRAHLRDVAFIAHKHRNYGVPVSELISEGNLGLLRALDKFDPERGIRFATYAAYWIRAYVIAFVLRSWSMVRNRSGVVRSKMFFRVRRERARARMLYGDDERVVDVVAERLGTTRRAVESMIQRLDARDVSLDDAKGGVPLIEVLHSEQTDAERAVADGQVRERVRGFLRGALEQLDTRERYIIESRFLSDTDGAMSLAKIGRELGVSRERARQLERRARDKLGECFTEHFGDDVGDALGVTSSTPSRAQDPAHVKSRCFDA
jgi:RNA polymerase sigma-32 factor